MSKSKEPTILERDFVENSRSRYGHILQMRRLNGDAIRDLQNVLGIARGQATAMIYPKAGSRCRGLSSRDLAL